MDRSTQILPGVLITEILEP